MLVVAIIGLAVILRAPRSEIGESWDGEGATEGPWGEVVLDRRAGRDPALASVAARLGSQRRVERRERRDGSSGWVSSSTRWNIFRCS